MGFNVRKTKFITSYANPRDMVSLPPLPQIAVAGRSNVGKSSLINALCGNKKLARVSQTPGKTRLLNVYDMDGALHLVDLPGFGYAKVSAQEQMRWADMIEGYLNSSERLACIALLVDIRHEPTRDDVRMMEWIRAANHEYQIIATKADKISKAARGRNIQMICRTLVVQPWEVIAYSSQDGTGKKELEEVFAKYSASEN